MANSGASIDREIEWLRAGRAGRHALLADNGVPWALADLALHLGEFLSVPLPGSFTPAQVVHALDDAGIDALLTDDLPRAAALLPGWRHDGRSPVSGLQRLRRTLDPRAVPAVPAGTRKVTYTSGSTAQPKGVCLVRPRARGHRAGRGRRDREPADPASPVRAAAGDPARERRRPVRAAAAWRDLPAARERRDGHELQPASMSRGCSAR